MHRHLRDLYKKTNKQQNFKKERSKFSKRTSKMHGSTHFICFMVYFPFRNKINGEWMRKLVIDRCKEEEGTTGNGEKPSKVLWPMTKTWRLSLNPSLHIHTSFYRILTCCWRDIFWRKLRSFPVLLKKFCALAFELHIIIISTHEAFKSTGNQRGVFLDEKIPSDTLRS
jgi:hypothetical protein